MPDSEKFSQGGPANFAKFFTNYIITNTKHDWIGILFNSSPSKVSKCKKAYSFQQREFYNIQIPSDMLKRIVHAEKKLNPNIILEKPIKKIVKLIKTTKPDIVFLNGFGIFNWLMLKAGEITKTPVIIQHAGIWTKELRIHSDLYSVWGRKLMEQMEKDSTQIASHEIFLNEWSKKYYNKTIVRINPKKTSIVPLPFNFDSFIKIEPAEGAEIFNFSKNKIHFGMIARWDEIKNHKAILILAKKAKQQKLPWIFHSVVDMPEDNKYSAIKKEYKKYVDVIPPLDRSGILQFCKAVDKLVLPSLFDVSPTVVLEAFATNTPIIISPNVGFANDFQDNNGGKWVINFDNATLAIKKIKKILKIKMPIPLCQKICSDHQSKKVFDQYINIFDNIITESKR